MWSRKKQCRPLTFFSALVTTAWFQNLGTFIFKQAIAAEVFLYNSIKMHQKLTSRSIPKISNAFGWMTISSEQIKTLGTTEGTKNIGTFILGAVIISCFTQSTTSTKCNFLSENVRVWIKNLKTGARNSAKALGIGVWKIIFCAFLPFKIIVSWRVAEVRVPPTDFVLHFTSDFHKECSTRSHVCRITQIQSAFKIFDPGASNGGLKVEIGPLGADLITFEVVEWLQNLKKNHRNYFQLFGTWFFQKQLDRLQVVRFWRLAHRWKRQDQYFPAHFESLPYNTPEGRKTFFLKIS